MKFYIRFRASVIILYVLFSSNILAQSTVACDNEDFEASTPGVISATNGIQGWTAAKLNYTLPNITHCTGLTSTAVTKGNPTAVEIISAPSGWIDTIIGANYPVYSVFGPGASNGGEQYNPAISIMKGNRILRLNNAAGVPYSFQTLEKTITVTQSNALFRIAYLPVLQEGSSCCNAPSFQIKFFNASGGNTLITCPSYSVVAPSASCPTNTTGMIPSPNPYIYQGYYRKWQILAVDLTPYMGSTITCKILAAYCLTGCSKFAYAYLDAQCGPMAILVNNSVLPAHTNSVTFTGCGITTATVVAPPDFSAYQWNGPAGFTSTLSTITTSAAGVYTLNITTAGTCSTITKYVNIGVYPAPSVSIATTRSVICKGEQVKITASGLTTYSWNVPGSTATINVSPSNTTTYNVSGVDANGCPGSVSITQSVNACASLTERSGGAPNIRIYPNPNEGEFKVEIERTIQDGTVEVRNSLGQLIRTFALADNPADLNIRGVQPGLYFITVKEGTSVVYNRRLAIQ